MSCSGGVFEQAGVLTHHRKYAFYGLCVPLRLTLAASLLVYNKPELYIICIILALLSLIGNARAVANEANCPVWWNRKFHILSALCVVLASVFVMYDILPPKIVPALLGLDVLYGVVTSFTSAAFSQ